MNRFTNRTGVAMIAAAAVTTLAACGGGSGGGGSSSASSTDTVTVALNADAAPSGYDPLLYSQGQFQFFSAMYDALFVTDKDGKVQPSLVKSFTSNAANTQLTLTLRDGVTFSDGSALDSTLVKKNLDRRSDKSLVAYGSLAPGQPSEIKDVTAPDPKTVVITWAKPQTSQSALADTSGVIVGATAVATPSTLATKPDGSGPYALNTGKTTKGSTYTLDKNAKAWDAATWPYSHLVVKVITDPQALANAVVSGQADVGSQLDQTTVALVTSKQSISKVGGTIVGFPVFDKLGKTNPAFAQPEVRLALSYATDRAAIVKDLHPASKATAQLFPSDAKGFDPALNDTYAYDVAKAKSLLAGAGYPNGFKIDLTVSGQPTADELAIQAQWKKIGVTLNFISATSTDQIFAAAVTQPLGFGPFAVGSNPAGFVAGVVVGGFANLQKAHDPKIEGALGAALGATGAAQDAAAKSLNAAITNDGWYIPVYEDFTYTGYNAKKVAAPAWAGTNNFLVLSSIRPAA